MKTVIFRMDDVFELSSNFIAFHDYFMKNNIPIVYAIIPGRLTQECIDFLNSEKEKYPHLIDLVQHGYLHENYHDDNLKYEFGKKRTYFQQKEDIVKGKEIMEKSFDKNFLDIFVPPFHGFDQKTLYIVKQLKFKAFSASYTSTNPLNLNYLPSYLYLDKSTISEILKKYIQTCKKTNNIISHFHPETMDFNVLKNFIKFLVKEKVKFIPFSKFKFKPNKITLKNLTFEVTNKCNLRCKMCNIWKEDPKYLDLNKIKEFLSSDLFNPLQSITLTGGECFLHPEIDSILDYLYSYYQEKKVKEINIVTNGYFTKKVTDVVEKYKGIKIHVSLDGLEEKHNLQRGNVKAFEFSMQTLKSLKHIKPTVKYTITPYNYKDLFNVYKLCVDNDLKFLFKFAESEVGNYYHRLDLRESMDLTEEQLLECKEVIKKILKLEYDAPKKVTNLKYILAILKWIDKKDVIKACYTTIFSLFISSNSDVYPCLYEEPIANLSTNWQDKLFGNEHLQMNEKALSLDCKKCLAYHGSLKSYNFK